MKVANWDVCAKLVIVIEVKKYTRLQRPGEPPRTQSGISAY